MLANSVAVAAQTQTNARTGTVLLPNVQGAVDLIARGRVHFADGRISAVEPLLPDEPCDNHLILPGFVDLHCHWPQAHVRGQFSGQLLPWLRDSIWPAEAAFADDAYALLCAEQFLTDAVSAGTCAALLFGPPFVSASQQFYTVAPAGFIDGPALMECNAPPELMRSVAEMLADLSRLPAHLLEKIVISPRFAPNMTADGLRLAGKFAKDNALPCQSHLSENLDEIAWVKQLFPDALDYTDVYDRAGLLHAKSVMAHGVFLSDRELARLAESQTMLAHCPTSNVALGSGRMDLAQLRKHGVRWVLATDVGAGPLLSQLDTMRTFLAIHQEHVSVTATEALCRSTAIPGQFLADIEPNLSGLGTLAVGAPAHLAIFDRPAGNEAETILLNLLTNPRESLETLPVEVVLWGRS